MTQITMKINFATSRFRDRMIPIQDLLLLHINYYYYYDLSINKFSRLLDQ